MLLLLAVGGFTALPAAACRSPPWRCSSLCLSSPWWCAADEEAGGSGADDASEEASEASEASEDEASDYEPSE